MLTVIYYFLLDWLSLTWYPKALWGHREQLSSLQTLQSYLEPRRGSGRTGAPRPCCSSCAGNARRTSSIKPQKIKGQRELSACERSDSSQCAGSRAQLWVCYKRRCFIPPTPPVLWSNPSAECSTLLANGKTGAGVIGNRCSRRDSTSQSARSRRGLTASALQRALISVRYG